MKREAKIIPLITSYIKIKRIYGFFEVKQTRTDTFNLSNFEPQQIDSLLSARSQGIVHKISDADQRLKPFDIISATPMESYVVICYPKNIVFINAFNVSQGIRNGLKSLSLGAAISLSSYHISLK